MNRSRLITLLLAVMMIGPARASAQEGQKPQPNPASKAYAQVETKVHASGQVTLKLDRGAIVNLSNPFGSITVTGWDRDSVEAKATGENGPEPLAVQESTTSSRRKVLLGIVSGRRGEVGLDVKLPRYADLELTSSRDGDINVTDVDGAVSISSGRGSVSLNRVGPLRVDRHGGDILATNVKGDMTARTSHGDVTAENVTGVLEIASASGDVAVRNAGADVRVSSASGEIAVTCAKGRAEVNSASGSITLIGVGGDIEASTASGDITFRGAIRADGVYRIKTLSGEAEMAIQASPPGFTATLITYNGELETAFPLKVGPSFRGGPINRRIIGSFGDGKAKLTLDSFNGSVRLVKMVSGGAAECK